MEAVRAENWLCTARVVLALYGYIWIQRDALELTAQPWRVQGLLDIYLLYSLLIFIILRLHGRADSSYRLTALAVDLFFAGTLTLLTGGPSSPYAVLFVFVVMSSAYRWGLHETNLTTSICAFLLLAEISAFQRWPQYFKHSGNTDFEAERLLLRATFLVIMSLLMGYMTVRERRSWAESALLARALGHTHAEARIDQALEKVFAEIGPLYLPRKAQMAFRKGNIHEVFFWETTRPFSNPQTGIVRTVLQFSELEAAAFSFPAHTWYLRRKPRRFSRAHHLLALDVSGRGVGSLDSGDLNAYLPAISVSSLMVSSFSFGEGWNGRLILIDPHVQADGHEALRFLQRFLKHIVPFLQDARLLRDIRMQGEDQVRARLTRELHDGTLQTLLSAEMQIEVLRKQRSSLAGELERRLAGLQALVHQEALSLRDLIENSKPLNFSPKELPDFIAELVARFRRDTGISVRLETKEDILLPSGVCHEIVRIIQEGLSNVRKHSRAHNVVVTLSEAEQGHYKLLIADDGEGFGFRGRVTQKQLDDSHRGPSVIKERVRLIGGELTIISTPGHGSRLEITIPDNSHG